MMSEDETYIVAAAAQIKKDIGKKFEVWDNSSDDEKIAAASSCPKLLEVEIRRQIAETTNPECVEHSCKASTAKKQRELAAKAQEALRPEALKSIKSDSEKKADKEDSSVTSVSSTPSMRKSGTTKGKKASSLCEPAARVLMGMLYGARMVR